MDYSVDVPIGIRPTTTSWRYQPNTTGNSTRYSASAATANIRANIGEAWGEIATLPLDSYSERVFCHVRGDAYMPYGATGTQYGDWDLQLAWAGSTGFSTTSLSAQSMDPTLADGDGRPLGINAWDTRTDPAYASTNQQSGWANFTTTGSVLYSQFVVAAGTRRLATLGGNRSPEVYYQFRNTDTGSTWTHEGVGTAPQLISVDGGNYATGTGTTRTIPTNATTGNSRVGPRLSTALGFGVDDRFTLPDEGYWQFLIWPQAVSVGHELEVPDGVSWDPAAEEGHQIGSVFYFSESSGAVFNASLQEIA
ncbi:hypothetical protein I8D64_08990 [Brachybacterium sp. MASK1Z-5]|uniref:Minor tail protein n=1 Tax=Brachybacterium halotolerans TaxID=2795215 RepID=A0ABS1BAM6_9MICO|nr:hypothetical protein [Brachybacterium halotolerans]MBK0331537.1 hypothetical protein [Brachybacterium halotolerans]